MKTRKLLASVAVSLLGILFVAPSLVFAAGSNITPAKCPAGFALANANIDPLQQTCCPVGHNTSASDCLFAKYINPAVTLLSAVAALAVIIGATMGGIQYASSSGDPQKAAAGKTKMVRALYALIVFLFLYSALQFLSPGGLSSNPVPSGGGGTVAQQCSKPFLGLKPWFAYLPDSAFESGTCNIVNFTVLGKSGTPSMVPAILLAIIDDLVRIAGYVAVIFVITGGVLYITSQGEPDRTKRARDTIINALIGLVVALVATAVVSFIGSKLS